MEKENDQLELTTAHRVAAITMMVAQFIFFLASIAMLVNYHAVDLPFIPYPSMTTHTATTNSHYICNTLLYLLFWAQHILMATLTYKVTWFTKWRYFALYDRYLYNISSGLILFLMLHNLQPTYDLLFTIPTYICLPFTFLGLYFIISGFNTLGHGIMMPFRVQTLLNNKFISITPY